MKTPYLTTYCRALLGETRPAYLPIWERQTPYPARSRNPGRRICGAFSPLSLSHRDVAVALALAHSRGHPGCRSSRRRRPVCRTCRCPGAPTRRPSATAAQPDCRDERQLRPLCLQQRARTAPLPADVRRGARYHRRTVQSRPAASPGHSPGAARADSKPAEQGRGADHRLWWLEGGRAIGRARRTCRRRGVPQRSARGARRPSPARLRPTPSLHLRCQLSQHWHCQKKRLGHDRPPHAVCFRRRSVRRTTLAAPAARGPLCLRRLRGIVDQLGLFSSGAGTLVRLHAHTRTRTRAHDAHTRAFARAHTHACTHPAAPRSPV